MHHKIRDSPECCFFLYNWKKDAMRKAYDPYEGSVLARPAESNRNFSMGITRFDQALLNNLY